jgi:hypothetical protein
MTIAPLHRVARRVTDALVLIAGVSALTWAWRADLAWCGQHVVISHWALDDDIGTVARGWRIAAVAIGLVAVFVVRPVLARWVGRVGPRKAGAAAGRVIAALVLGLAASETILEYARSKKGDPFLPFHTENRIGQLDPRYGWVWQPSRATVLRTAGRPIEYAINVEHDRARSIDDLPDPSLPTILFTGESISVGHGLPWQETLPALVGDAMGVQVVSLAVHAYGSDQAFLRLADTLPRFARPVALVTLFMPCLIWRMTHSDHPRLSFVRGSLTLLPPEKSWRDVALGQLWLEVVRYDSASPVRLAAQIFRETARLAAEKSAVALFVRPYFKKREDDALIDELFTGQAIPCVRVDVGDDVLPFDHHPDANATRRIADAVVAALSSHGLRR